GNRPQNRGQIGHLVVKLRCLASLRSEGGRIARNGWPNSPECALLELFMVMALAFGLSKLLGAQVVVRAIGVIGGVFLLWMGVGIVKDVIVKKISLSTTPGSSTRSGGVLVASGAATSLSNPYWTLWWATIGVGFLTKSMVQAGTSGLGVFYIGHILGDYVWYGIVGFAVAAGRRIFSDRVYRSTLLICGLFLILLAFSFIGDFKIF
ncbi:MAG: LysE family translocator, partial [Actinobacteria bacterium]|nr:LysE family translocator [Actinomycetota bacterium]